MDWHPVITEHSDKGGDVVIGLLIAAGTATMLIIGVRQISGLLFSIPMAFLLALGRHYWQKRHKVHLILLGDKDHWTPRSSH